MNKLLFTPGPLTTSESVKHAMMKDLGSRDTDFIGIIASIRNNLLSLAGVSKEMGYDSVIIQGSGTFGVESVLSSCLSANHKLLILINGAYGERIRKIAEIHKVNYTVLQCNENEIISPEEVQNTLLNDAEITHVALIHSETTTGLFNPLNEIAAVVASSNKKLIVDAMSSFGGVSIDLKEIPLDFLISSSNKCIEGVPGFAFVIAKKHAIEQCKGQAKSLSLDLYEQWYALENTGQFRFTPPTHVIIAFHQAILELINEGGIGAREKRYKENKAILDKGMEALGFQEYLPKEIQGHIISTFLFPNSEKFNFKSFYNSLSDKGFVIYPGKLSQMDCFRIGNIGQIFPYHVTALLLAIEEIGKEQEFLQEKVNA